MDTLALVVPVTTVDRTWSNHVLRTGHTGLTRVSFAMTEQPQTIGRTRITGVAGSVDRPCLERILGFLAASLDLPGPR